MPFDERYLDQLRAAVSVSSIVARKFKLKKNGAEWQVTDDPSFHINDKKQRWFDNGAAQIDGDIFSFLQVYYGMSFPRAVEEIAKLANIAPPDRGGAFQPRSDTLGSKRNAATEADPSGSASTISKSKPRIVATYDYTDEKGFLIYQVVRFEPKGFRQRRPQRADDDPNKIDRNGFVWKLDGIEHGLYRLPAIRREMSEPREEQRTIVLCEGERDVHTMETWDFLATTNSGGAENFTASMAEVLRDARDVVILEDNDEAGAIRTAEIAPMLLQVGARVRALKIADYWPNCPAKGDVSDWRDRGIGNPDKLYEILDRLPDWKPVPYKSKLGAKMWGDLDKPRIPYEWTIKDIIPRKENVLIIGPSRSGKTFKTLDLAMHVARGIAYMDRRVIQGGIVYCSYEGQAGFDNRLRAYMQYHRLSAADPIPFMWITRPPGLYASEDNVTALASEILGMTESWSCKIAAIVIDTHNSATRGSSEIRSEDIGKIFDRYDKLAEMAKAPLWIVGHTNAAGTHRGNEQVFNRIETTIMVKREMEGRGASAAPVRHDGRIVRIASVEKQREGIDGLIWKFTLHRLEIDRDEDGDPITSMVPVIIEGASDEEETSSKPRVPVAPGSFHMSPIQQRFFRALLKALNENAVPPPAALGVPFSVNQVVTYSDIGRIYLENEPVFEDTQKGRDERRNKIAGQMRKARNELAEKNVIGVKPLGEDTRETSPIHYIWLTGRPVAGANEFRWPAPAANGNGAGNGVSELMPDPLF